MRNMTEVRDADRQLLMNMDKQKLVDLLLMHLRDMWSVDGLYYLGIEKRFGTDSATEIDAEVWKAMASIEAKRLRKTMGLKRKGVAGVVEALRLTGWSLDLEHKEIVESDGEAAFINHECRVQNTRVSKGLSVFACKPVRFGYLQQFVQEIDPEVKIECVACPPDEMSEGIWCSWRLTHASPD
jgi:polysaccharide pyruvyl transferase WcaK-like protein